MARRTDIDWEAIRSDYEIRGIGYRELAVKYGISKGGISAKATSEGWVKSINEPLVQLKVNAIQQLNEANKEIMNLPSHAVHFVDQEVDRRLRLANLITSGIEKSQKLANDLLNVAETLGTETEDGFKAALIATDNHSKVTQRNAAVIFGTVPESKGSDGNNRYGSIVDKLKVKHARG